MTTNHQVAVNGGNDRTTYSASVGYYKGQNNYEAHSFERMTAKLSLDTEITSFLKVGLSTLNTYISIKGRIPIRWKWPYVLLLSYSVQRRRFSAYLPTR